MTDIPSSSPRPAGQALLFRISNYMSLWSHVLFFLAVIINMLVAVSYPFTDDWPSEC